MPFGLRLGRRSNGYNFYNKELFVVTVELLDQSTLECTLCLMSSGQECLENLGQRLGMQDIRNYFGLLFYSRRSMFQWIDLEKPVKKQLEKGAESWRLYLRVQYYVPDVETILDEVSRSHYYLQLKTQIIDDRVKCSRDDAVRLASYSLQSEFGDFDIERHTLDYFSSYALLPRSMTASKQEYDILMETVLEAHKNLYGVPPAVAETVYITEVQQLEGYGQEGFPSKDLQTNADVCLGVSLKGIFVVNSFSITLFKWTDIANLIHHKKLYTLELNDGNRRNYLMADGESARFTWSVCVRQHQYFLKANAKLNDEIQEVIVMPQSLNDNVDHCTTIPTQENVPVTVDRNANAPYENINNETSAITNGLLYNEAIPAYPSQQISAVEPVLNSHSSRDLPQRELREIPKVMDASYESANLSTYSNITTVQVHHEPPWASKAITGSDKEYVAMENSINLPPYQNAPAYEEFVREKYGLQQISSSNAVHFPAALGGYPAGYQPRRLTYTSSMNSPVKPFCLTKNSFAVQKEWPSAKDPPRLSLPQTNGMLAHFDNLQASNPFANSSPDLYTYHNLGLRTLTLKPQVQSIAPQSFPFSYNYNSVPDLSAQYLRNINQKMYLTQPVNYVPIPVVQQLQPRSHNRFPSGSEPSIPNMATYSVVLSPNDKHKQFKSASRHLSIDTLNHNGGGSHGISDYKIIDRNKAGLNGFVIPENVREGQSLPVPINRNQQFAKSNGRDPMHFEENVYENIQELRAALLKESKQEALREKEKAENKMKVEDSRIEQREGLQIDPSENLDQLHEKPIVQIMKENQTVEPVRTKLDSSRQLAPSRQLENDKECVFLDKPTKVEVLNSSNVSTISKDPRISALETKLEDVDLMRDFDLLPRMNPTEKFSTALIPENIPRNRFRDILPYESNRIRLPPTKENRSGYINASSVSMKIDKTQQKYVAAQGPLAHTVVDFWHTVLVCNVKLIVMVTEFNEGGQEKCYTYYPQSSEEDKNTLTFGDFQVKCNFIIESSTYVTSSLTLVHNDNSITVWHIRYTGWPDHTCPQDVQGFLSFLEGIDAIYRLSGREGSSLTLNRSKKKGKNQGLINNALQSAPILVHCSAGVGRSGVVILCDSILRSLDTTKDIDVPNSLTQLRMQRMISVQNFGQYKFVFRVLAQYLKNSRLI